MTQEKRECIHYTSGIAGLLKNMAALGYCKKEFTKAAEWVDKGFDKLLADLTLDELFRLKKEISMLDISIAQRKATKPNENWIAMPVSDLEFFLEDCMGECRFCIKNEAETKGCLKRKKLKELCIDGTGTRSDCPYKGN